MPNWHLKNLPRMLFEFCESLSYESGLPTVNSLSLSSLGFWTLPFMRRDVTKALLIVSRRVACFVSVYFL